LSQVLRSFYWNVIYITGFLALLISFVLTYQMVTMDVPCFLIGVYYYCWWMFFISINVHYSCFVSRWWLFWNGKCFVQF